MYMYIHISHLINLAPGHLAPAASAAEAQQELRGQGPAPRVRTGYAMLHCTALCYATL